MADDGKEWGEVNSVIILRGYLVMYVDTGQGMARGWIILSDCHPKMWSLVTTHIALNTSNELLERKKIDEKPLNQ